MPTESYYADEQAFTGLKETEPWVTMQFAPSSPPMATSLMSRDRRSHVTRPQSTSECSQRAFATIGSSATGLGRAGLRSAK